MKKSILKIMVMAWAALAGVQAFANDAPIPFFILNKSRYNIQVDNQTLLPGKAIRTQSGRGKKVSISAVLSEGKIVNSTLNVAQYLENYSYQKWDSSKNAPSTKVTTQFITESGDMYLYFNKQARQGDKPDKYTPVFLVDVGVMWPIGRISIDYTTLDKAKVKYPSAGLQ